MKELRLPPRLYQQKIFETASQNDTLVILPTGTGKTLIAQMLSIDRFKKFPLQKILILAPTRPLIEQHLKSFQENLPDQFSDMQLFTGKTTATKRNKTWQTAEFIFSTPQCISNDLKKELYSLEDVSLLIIDEAHRCLKNYAYNFISQKYKTQSINPKVLALTASPGANKKTIRELCDNLGINELEIRTRDSPDVKQYLQDLEFEKIEVDFPAEFLEIKLLLEQIYNKKIQELKNRKVLFTTPTKTLLLKTQSRLMSTNKKSLNTFMAISATASALKISHAIQLLETQTLSSFTAYLKNLYQQAAQNKSKAVKKLTTTPEFAKAFSMATTLNKEHPKLNKLYQIVQDQLLKNPTSKIIVFAQFRETVRQIAEYLNKIPNAQAKTFVGQAIKKHDKGQTTGLKQTEQKALIEQFSRGELNILVATSIAEEGLDIPEVSEVIFYEPIPSAIRKIQRAGRTARLAPGKLKILITKKTLDETFYFSAHHKEKQMYSGITQIKKEFDAKLNTLKNPTDKQSKLHSFSQQSTT
jgi:ERCC4-related helicase